MLALVLGRRLPGWAYMWTLAVAIYAAVKWLSWWRGRKVPHSAARSLAFLFLWPGMDAEAFLDGRTVVPPPSASAWVLGGLKTALGAALLWIGVRLVPPQHPFLRGWAGMLGLIFLLHFGSFDLLARAWQAAGICAEPIMRSPIRSQSLGEFWGKRWNLGFRQLSHDFLFRPALPKLGLAGATMLVFLASGIIHDLVISVPARAGYGLPTAYFLLQGLAALAERSATVRMLGLQSGLRGWLWTVLVTAGPAYLLFHPWFVARVILPFLVAIHAL